MPTLLVIWIAKLAAWLTKASGRGDATALPGLIAERLQPKILERLGAKLPKGCVMITGTNGKTTTTRMVAAALGEDRLLVNKAGSNLTRGLISTLIQASNLGGKIHYDMGVFEVDEAAFAPAAKALKPKAVMVLNLFRDQLDRYGELNTLAGKLHGALEGLDTTAILNVDDPLVAHLGKDLQNVVYFGMNEAAVKKLAHDFAADSHVCPECHHELEYKNSYYAHIGIYHCGSCSFARPTTDVVGNATSVSLSGGIVAITADNKKASLKLKLPGLYNLYNGLAAVAMAQHLGVDVSDAVGRIQAMPAAFGRAEVVEVDGRKLQLLLVKNPTGYNQVIQAYEQGREALPMLMVVNDLIADGRDVSWLWDVAFEDMDLSKRVTTAGTRTYDIALRLKYADAKTEVQTNLEVALDSFIQTVPKGGTGLILPTYTAMIQLRRPLAKRGQIAEMHS